MRGFYTVLVLAAISAPQMGYALQAAAGTTTTQSSPVQTPSATPGATPQSEAVSALVKPSLDSTRETVGSLQMEKWKRGPLRDEAGANIDSIRQDIESTLPDLLKAADANPGATSKLLPVSRNINALYDVVLRVVNAARVTAPGDQFTALQETLAGLEKSRHALEDRIQDGAVAQEKQIGDLQVALKVQAKPPVCPVVEPAPAPAAPAKKPTPRKRKPAAKPPTTTPPSNGQPANSQPGGSTKPNQ
ncbi:hypothetical protein [Acidicapsa acidisoli]|uniref:hypothetical protein n=1 Tax=Acidicapsa acidisoli TaxID=1615681 RepID=UPI0021E09771|nr:hypothetical protein [Acidicapsa acidisoli]